MDYKVLAASEKVLDTLKKADIHLNHQKEDVQDEHKSNDDIRVNNAYSLFVPVRVINGNGLSGYLCDIFENGLNNAATSQGTVFLANGASTIYALPPGTVMYAQKISLQQIGTNE